MVSKKDLKRTQKQIATLTAAFIRDRPSMLKRYGKEAIRDHVTNDLLRLAFERMARAEQATPG